MKSFHYYHTVFISTVIAITPLAGKATVFFSDTFGSGSTIVSATPTAPTATSASYQVSSSKGWVPNPPTLTSGDLKFGIATTSSGGAELEALFTSAPVSLTAPGDFIRLTVTFTNTGLLTTNCLLGFGLYNGNQVQPLAGGLNGTAVNTVSDKATGGVQNWQGYWGQRSFTGVNSRIVLRLPQTAGTDNRNQNLTSTGSGSLSYGNPGGATIGTQSTTPSGVMVTGQPYTVVLTIVLTDVNTLAITNTYYDGASTNAAVLCEFGASAAGGSYTGATFDGLAIGWRATANNVIGTGMDISSIAVDGSVTVISTPPTITQEPVDATVAVGGSAPFTVAATGVNVSYQWKRFGTNLLNAGNISGATSSTLIINNASVADAASGANGYYCVVTGQGNFSTNSTTNSLTVVPARNLVWNGAGTVWDINNSPNWNDGANPTTFNYGDSVTFDDTGAGNPLVTLSGNFLSASKWLVTGGTSYAFNGSGNFAGPGSLVFNSSAAGTIQVSVANTHTGGTIISNSNPALDIYFQQYQGLGNGPLTLAKPGMMEIVPNGSATLGIPADITVKDDFTIQFDGNGTFAGVMLGNIAGTTGKTLTLAPQNPAVLSRYRAYGANTVCNANIAINPNGNPTTVAMIDGVVLAPYQASPGTQTYNGVISGNGGIVQRGTGTTILNGANTYTGGTTPTTGSIGLGNDAALGTGVLSISPETGSASSSGTIFPSGGPRTIANTIQYPSGTNNQTLIIGGTDNITFTGGFNLAGADGIGTNRTIQVTNTAATTFSGTITDNGNTSGLTKTGNGALYLNGTDNYTGPTVVNAGRLGGSGSITSPVAVQTNGTISGGAATGIGTFTVNNNLSLDNGKVLVRVNKALSPGQSNDLISVSGTLANTGTNSITVTNIGASAIAVGDTFKVFNKAVTGGNAMSVTGGGVNWNNNLAVDGTISVASVISTVATNPTNMTFSVSSGNMSISWPADHLGWYLQMNTNSLTSNTWVDVAGSSTSTNAVIPINPSVRNAFFRMSLQP
jgi:fibronectin-binding autotransporter adhesin